MTAMELAKGLPKCRDWVKGTGAPAGAGAADVWETADAAGALDAAEGEAEAELSSATTATTTTATATWAAAAVATAI